jgi:integrase
MYLPHAAKTLKAASIARRIAAIAYYHEQAGQPSPMAHPTVKNVWKGVRREIGIAQKGKSAATIEVLRDAVAPFGARRIDVRDRAILLLGFAAAMRRSEIVALDVADLAFASEGVSVLIRRSKTDQEGAGALLGVPFSAPTLICAPCGRYRRGSSNLTKHPGCALVRRLESAFASRGAALRSSRRPDRRPPVCGRRRRRRLLGPLDALWVLNFSRRCGRRRARNLESNPAQVARHGAPVRAAIA